MKSLKVLHLEKKDYIFLLYLFISYNFRIQSLPACCLMSIYYTYFIIFMNSTLSLSTDNHRILCCHIIYRRVIRAWRNVNIMIAILGALLAFGVIVTYIGPYCKKLCIQHGKHRFVFYFICENLYSKKKKKKMRYKSNPKCYIIIKINVIIYYF